MSDNLTVSDVVMTLNRMKSYHGEVLIFNHSDEEIDVYSGLKEVITELNLSQNPEDEVQDSTLSLIFNGNIKIWDKNLEELDKYKVEYPNITDTVIYETYERLIRDAAKICSIIAPGMFR